MEDPEELDPYVSTPVCKVHYYDSVTSGMSSSYATCLTELEEIKRLVFSYHYISVVKIFIL